MRHTKTGSNMSHNTTVEKKHKVTGIDRTETLKYDIGIVILQFGIKLSLTLRPTQGEEKRTKWS